jgi:CRP-like cAMP-binding protein
MSSHEGSRQAQQELLRSASLLAGLKDSSVGKLANASRFVKVAKGSFLFYQHDPADSLYILRSGEMVVVLSSLDGREMIIDELKPGDCFGEVALLTSGERTAGAQAREQSEVLEIGSKAFLSVLDEEPLLARRMLEIATQRLFKSQKRESALAFLDAPARVARVLLNMDEMDRMGEDKGYIVLSQEELAQRTGLTRQTVANSLGQWRRRNWILTGRGRIMLLNRDELRRIHEQALL